MDRTGPQPHELYAKAAAEYPDDERARAGRYRELMREAGLLIPGRPEPLPCGWPREGGGI